jgi:hypothetical protein
MSSGAQQRIAELSAMLAADGADEKSPPDKS